MGAELSQYNIEWNILRWLHHHQANCLFWVFIWKRYCLVINQFSEFTRNCIQTIIIIANYLINNWIIAELRSESVAKWDSITVSVSVTLPCNARNAKMVELLNFISRKQFSKRPVKNIAWVHLHCFFFHDTRKNF